MNKKFYLFKETMVLKITLSMFLSLLISAHGKEAAEKIYKGMDTVNSILNNIDYRDVRQSNAWSKEAIYEISALEIMKGYGDQTFGRTASVTKEQALALIYNAAGKETEAKVAAEVIDARRAADSRKTFAPAMWSDGYLQLAADDGLISSKDLEDALTLDRSALTENSFNRNSPAQRQDVAFWIATVLGLPPVYGQQKIFNSYSDWSQADPYKIPYIEAVLQNNIMSGMGNGRFNPGGNVTREQMAQIIQNALSIVLPLRGYEKKLGTVEEIETSINFTDGQGVMTYIYNVRNSNGRKHQIITEQFAGQTGNNRNEQTGSIKQKENTDFIVYKNGSLGKSSTLEVGDRIEYTVTSDDKVVFVKVISNTSKTNYLVAKVNNIDTSRQTINISKVFDLKYPDVDLDDKNFSFDGEGKDINATFVYSSNAEVFVDNVRSSIESIKPGMDVILSITDNMVMGIKTVILKLREQGVASGIVEDNNPQLGYITLYNENRTSDQSTPNIKTYNYSNPKNITVMKNHKPASIEEIEGGDSAYIKFDDEGNIKLISAVDNYIQKYGKVLSKKTAYLAV